MKRLLISAILLLAFLSGAQAQTVINPQRQTVAQLPAASIAAGISYTVTDGTTISDCTVGGGTITLMCLSNGSVWALDPHGFAPLTGITNASNAAAGTLGEFVQTLVVSGSAVSMTTATATNILSVSLSAGDWDCMGNLNFLTTSATMVVTSPQEADIGLTSPPAMVTDGSEEWYAIALTTATSKFSIALPRKRVNVTSSSTSVFLTGEATFSAGTTKGYGQLSCRRVR
jgi:hypothetical protein